MIVPVTDLTRAVEFYSTLLETDGERVSDGRHYFDCRGTLLACVSERHATEEHFRPLPDYCYLAVDDLEAALERARAAGADVEAEIDSYPWGERSFYVRDPFGNPLCFVDASTVFLGGRVVH
ncbi:MAG: VOC family protein [Dehalococcoidia bacterium]|nr:VOC family protein [Dehalococcoidia bacterium]